MRDQQKNLHLYRDPANFVGRWSLVASNSFRQMPKRRTTSESPAPRDFVSLF